MIKFENKKNGRYYYIIVQTDLFNEHVLTVIRGGIHSNIRVVRTYGFNCQQAISKEIERLRKKRVSRGYTLIE